MPRSRILYHVCLILKSTFLLFSRITPDSLWQSGCGERLLDAGVAVAAGRVPSSRGGRRRRLLEAGRPAPVRRRAFCLLLPMGRSLFPEARGWRRQASAGLCPCPGWWARSRGVSCDRHPVHFSVWCSWGRGGHSRAVASETRRVRS